jgi:hypothetical protein
MFSSFPRPEDVTMEESKDSNICTKPRANLISKIGKFFRRKKKMNGVE